MSEYSSTQIYYNTREFCHRDVYKHLAFLRKSLSELQSTSKQTLVDNTLYWQKEVERARQDKDKEWSEKIALAEAENNNLRTVIENLTKSDESKGIIDYRLLEAESQIDKLSRQLDEKLIQISKLQIALAEQSKKMYELEKTSLLLYCQYTRSRMKEKPKVKEGEEKYEFKNEGKLDCDKF